MAVEKIVNIKVNDNIDQTEKSVGSLKAELRKAQNEVAALSDKFGATSKEAIEAAKRASELKDKIGDAKSLTDAFNPDAKFKSLSASIGGVAGAFSAYQGALSVAGIESKDFEKQLLRVQGAMAISQGLQSLGEAQDSFKQLKAVALDAFKGIKAAIGSTGIGLLVIALGTIYAYWDDIKEAVSGVSEEQKKSNATLNESLKKQKEALSNLDAQDATLKRQGKSEREILALKEKQVQRVIDLQIKTLESDIKLRKSAEESATRNKQMLTDMLKVLLLPINYTLKSIDLIGKAMGKNFDLVEKFNGGIAKLVFDPEEVKKQGDLANKEEQKQLRELINKRDTYHEQIKTLDDQKAKEKKERDAKAHEEYLKKLREQYEAEALETSQFLESLQQLKNDKQDEADQTFVDWTQRYEKAYTDSIALELNARQAFEDAKYNIANQGLELLSGLAGKNKAIATGVLILEKSLAISQIITTASRSIAQASANLAATPAVIGTVPNPMYPVQLAATTKGILTTKISAGLSIANILAQTIGKLSSSSGLGGGTSGGGASGGGGATAPSFNIVGQNSNNQLAQSIANKQSQPVEAYVVSGNISNAQSLDRNRVNTATFN